MAWVLQMLMVVYLVRLMFGVIAGSFRSSYFGSSVQGKSNQCDSVSVAKNLKKVE